MRSGTFLRQSLPWIGTKFIGGSWPGNHQNNVFGIEGGESLFWSNPGDWREINFVDVTNKAPANTQGQGRCGGLPSHVCGTAAQAVARRLTLLAVPPGRVQQGTPCGEAQAGTLAVCAKSVGDASRSPATTNSRCL